MGIALTANGPAQACHVAELTGFDDASHLSRVFVEQRGVRPGEYRRQRDVACAAPPASLADPHAAG